MEYSVSLRKRRGHRRASQRGIFEIPQSANQQPGAHEQHDAKRHLQGDNDSAARDLPASVFEVAAEVFSASSAPPERAIRSGAKPNASAAKTRIPSVNSSTVLSGARLVSIRAHRPSIRAAISAKAHASAPPPLQGSRSPSAAAETTRHALRPVPCAEKTHAAALHCAPSAA